MHRKIIWIVVVAILIAGGAYWYWIAKKPEAVYCTQDAKMCPDGSYVGRVGPNCEFAVCPTGDNTAGWATFSDEERGISFKYPQELPTVYIRTVDWPPAAQVLEGSLACAPGGSPEERAGGTREVLVNGRKYCVTEVVGAAAGSRYSQYAYGFEADGQTVILTFSLQFPQCVNYDDPDKTNCENERTAFDVNSIVDRIAQSFRFD